MARLVLSVYVCDAVHLAAAQCVCMRMHMHMAEVHYFVAIVRIIH